MWYNYAMLSKHCETCGKKFYKSPTRSKKDFIERARFCSNSCKVKLQKNFYKYWEGRKRPELILTESSRTMFKKGQLSDKKGKPNLQATKHGMVNTKFYSRWRALKQRCSNPKHKAYEDYGARGIRNEWDSFERFKEDMHDSYLAHIEEFGEDQTQLDRLDNNGNYNKENCRWATRAEQMRNRRNNHLITYNGETKCMTDWAKDLGISYTSLWKRLKKTTIEEALKV